MARVVQAADFKDQVDSHLAVPDLFLISRGLPLVTRDDHETAERAAFLYLLHVRGHKLMKEF